MTLVIGEIATLSPHIQVQWRCHLDHSDAGEMQFFFITCEIFWVYRYFYYRYEGNTVVIYIWQLWYGFSVSHSLRAIFSHSGLFQCPVEAVRMEQVRDALPKPLSPGLHKALWRHGFVRKEVPFNFHYNFEGEKNSEFSCLWLICVPNAVESHYSWQTEPRSRKKGWQGRNNCRIMKGLRLKLGSFHFTLQS